jgi:ectoine hydroxylase-related dioxygenase (phytanoyl-CoA dioxygenase family)
MLTPAQIDEFYEVGFLVLRGVFSAAEMAEVSAGFDRLQATAAALKADSANAMIMHDGSQFVLRAAPDGGASSIRRVVWVGAAEPVLDRYGEDPRLLAIARDILGTTAGDHLINQAHFKLPNDGISFPWHQDSQHRGYGTAAWTDVNGRGSYCQMALAVDASTVENGPLKFIPRSCADGHLALKYREDDQTEDPRIRAQDAVSIIAEPGDLAVFGPYTIHGSEPNRSTAPRRVFINGFAAPGANHRNYPGHDHGAGRTVQFPAR